MIPAAALGAVLLFSTLAFAATEQWALSIAQSSIFVLGVYCAIARKLLFHPMAFLPAGVACLGAVQVATGVTVYRFVTLNGIVNWTAYFALFVISLHVFADPEIFRRFRRAVLYAGCAIAVLSTAQYFTSKGAIYWMFPVRSGVAFGPFVNPDHYAAFIELIIPLAIYEALRDHRRLWLHTAMIGVLYGSVIASASRTGVALATLEVLLLPLLARRPAMALRIAAVFVVCAGVGTAVVGGDVIWKRFQDKDPFRYRREIVKSTAQMIVRRPWTGFGLGSFATVYPEFATFDIGLLVDHAHNDWAEWAAEGGIPLLLLIAPLAVVSFPRAMRREWALGVHAVSLHSLVDFPLQIPAIAFLVFVLLGALYADSDSGTLAPI